MNRDVVVPASLDDLRGAVEGTVEIPNYLNWYGCRFYDLSVPRRVESLYTAVVREALSKDDLRFLNKGVLLELWSALRIPVRVRAAWESAFPELVG